MNVVMEHLTDRRVKENLLMTAAAKRAAREFLANSGFTEIDTPILMPRTGELYNKTFDIMLEDVPAMLADSPQIYKMLLSKAGYEKYFQFAHCFRVITGENDLHTRLSEFIQLDIELRDTSLDALIELAVKLISNIGEKLDKAIKITHMQGLDCRAEYGSEMRPDLRENKDGISLVIIRNMPLTNDGKTPCHHIFAMPSKHGLTDPDILTELTTESFDIVMNGVEIGGGDMRVNDCGLQRKLMRMFNVDESRYTNYLQTLDEYGGGNGGFAVGLERMITVLSGSQNIRQAAAFPDHYKRGVN